MLFRWISRDRVWVDFSSNLNLKEYLKDFSHQYSLMVNVLLFYISTLMIMMHSKKENQWSLKDISEARFQN